MAGIMVGASKGFFMANTPVTFDELLQALMDAYPHIADDELRAKIGKLIMKARGV